MRGIIFKMNMKNAGKYLSGGLDGIGIYNFKCESVAFHDA